MRMEYSAGVCLTQRGVWGYNPVIQYPFFGTGTST
jgi:hypothetical protein